MTRKEWATLADEISIATQQPWADGQIEVFYKRLADLPGSAVAAGVVRFLETAQFKAIPAVGVIRQLSVEFRDGIAATPEQAWAIVQETMSACGYTLNEKDVAKVKAALGPTIHQAIRFMGGWNRLYDSRSLDTVLFAQFRDGWMRAVDQWKRLSSSSDASRPAVVGIPKSAAADLAKSLSASNDREPTAGISTKTVQKLLPPK